MARIPQYDATVKTNPLANKRASAFITPAAAGAGVSEAIARLGQGVASVAEAMDYKDQITAKADSDNAYNQYMDHRRQVLYDPETGYLNQTGSNALGGSRDNALAELSKRRAAVEAGLSPRALADFKRRADGVDNTVKDNTIKHSSQELRSYSSEQTAAAVKASLDAAGLAYNDEATSEKYLNEALNGVREKAILEGWPKEKLDEALAAATSDTVAQRAVNMAYDDPIVADQYLDANVDKMDRNRYLELKDGLKGAVLSKKAERRIGPMFTPGGAGAAPPRSAEAVERGNSLIQTASTVMGMDENEQNDAIRQYLADGGVNLDPAKTAWCAAFVNGTLGQRGMKGTSSNMARSFLNWGQDASGSPSVGDVIVLKRGAPPYGHVGFIAGINEDGSYRVLGGNQGDSVSVSNYSGDKVLGIRRAGGANAANFTPEGGQPTLSTQGGSGEPELGSTADDPFVGNSGGDTLGGNSGEDTLGGGAGDDLPGETPAAPANEPTNQGLAGGLAEIMKEPDPELREELLKQFTQRLKVRDTTKALEREQLMDDAWKEISENGTNPDTIPPEVQTKIGAAGMQTLRTAHQNKLTGTDAHDPELFQHFFDLSLSTDPAKQQEFLETDLNDFSDQLSEQALTDLKKDQAEARADKEIRTSGKASETIYERADYGKAAESAADQFEIIMGPRTGAKATDATKQAWVNFNKQLKVRMKLYADTNGVAMPDEVLDREIGTLLFRTTISTPRAIVGSKSRDTIAADIPYREGGSSVEIKVDEQDIPFAERERITLRLADRWGRAPTQEEVIDQYEMERLNDVGLRPELVDIPKKMIERIRADNNGISDEDVISLYLDIMTAPFSP